MDNQEEKHFHFPVFPASRGLSRFFYFLFAFLTVLLEIVGPVVTALCVSQVWADDSFIKRFIIVTVVTLVMVVFKVIEEKLKKLDIYYYNYRKIYQIYSAIVGALLPIGVMILCLIIGHSMQTTIDKILLTIEISAGLIGAGIIVDRVLVNECRAYFSALNLRDKIDQANYIDGKLHK